MYQRMGRSQTGVVDIEQAYALAQSKLREQEHNIVELREENRTYETTCRHRVL